MTAYRIFWMYPDQYIHTVAIVYAYHSIILVSYTIAHESNGVVELTDTIPDKDLIDKSDVVTLGINTESKAILLVQRIRPIESN